MYFAHPMRTVRSFLRLCVPVCTALLGGCETAPNVNPYGRPTPPAAARPIDRDVFEISDLDRRPVPRLQRPPHYPVEMRRAGVSGRAVVDFIIDETGTVRDAYVIETTYPVFGAAAVECVSAWQFAPGLRGRSPVKTHLQVPIVFTLSDSR